MTVCPLDLSHLEWINAIERKAYAHPWSVRQLSDSLQGEHLVWGLKQDGKLLGYLIWMRVLDEIHILNLAVDPQRRRQGIARTLLEALLTEARRIEVCTIFLEVRISNEPAIALYESAGFCEMGRRRNYYPCENGREDAILMGMSW